MKKLNVLAAISLALIVQSREAVYAYENKADCINILTSDKSDDEMIELLCDGITYKTKEIAKDEEWEQERERLENEAFSGEYLEKTKPQREAARKHRERAERLREAEEAIWREQAKRSREIERQRRAEEYCFLRFNPHYNIHKDGRIVDISAMEIGKYQVHNTGINDCIRDYFKRNTQ